MTLSGVAMVSAYEAQTVNVTAHVENALFVSTPDWNAGQFGTVFPEEFINKEFIVRMSNSFCQEDQERVLSIDYQIWVDRMVKPGGGYFPWLGDALAFSIDGQSGLQDGEEWAWVGDGAARPLLVTSDNLTKRDVDPADGEYDDDLDYVRVGLDVPVFREYYIFETDEKPKPSGKDIPSVIIETDDPRYDPYPDGIDDVYLGATIIIQVTEVYEE
jgi:hypothetical protein